MVTDTNVVVSALYNPHSVPGRILEAANKGRISLCAPEAVRLELRRVLARVLDFTPTQVWSALQSLRIEWIPEQIYASQLAEARSLLRDGDDAHVLACARALACDAVTGDKDLHATGDRTVRIWAPAELEEAAD